MKIRTELIKELFVELFFFAFLPAACCQTATQWAPPFFPAGLRQRGGPEWGRSRLVAMLRRRHPEPPALRRLGCHHRAICATELGRAVKPPAEGSQQRGSGGDLAASFARDGYLFLPAACGAARRNFAIFT